MPPLVFYILFFVPRKAPRYRLESVFMRIWGGFDSLIPCFYGEWLKQPFSLFYAGFGVSKQYNIYQENQLCGTVLGYSVPKMCHAHWSKWYPSSSNLSIYSCASFGNHSIACKSPLILLFKRLVSGPLRLLFDACTFEVVHLQFDGS